MATTANRRLNPGNIRYFGGDSSPHPLPSLTDIQTASYERFL